MDRQTVSLGKFRFKVSSYVGRFVMALAMVFALTLLTSHAMQAQTFSVLYHFTGGADGYSPGSGVTVAPSGVLYGTAAFGGTFAADCGGPGCGAVYRLTNHGSGWVLTPLYEFRGSDGELPFGGVTIRPNGALYGTTSFGGADGFGLVFELRPPATFCRSVQCYWNETVLHTFTGPPDGGLPEYVNLAFDQAGNIYGTTYYGGTGGYGIVFELTPSGGGYTESIIHSFGFGAGGSYPNSGVVLDSAGNVYGESPLANPIIDASGNLYGTAGVVYKLAPSGGGFTYSVIYIFNSYCGYQSALAMDAAGNFFGACDRGPGADGDGWIFELTNCSQTCMVVDLHDFNGSDGAGPLGTPALDANGNLYGTTAGGGTGNCNGNPCGVVWEIAGVSAPH